MDDNTVEQVPEFKYVGSIITEDGKNKKDIMKWIKEAKVVVNHKKQLLCSNNFSLEMKKKLTKSSIWSVALYGSEMWTVGTNEERAINAFETWRWWRMLEIKWADRITKDKVFQNVEEERLY